MKKPRRNRRTREEWQQLIEAQQESGLNPTEFCNQRFISQKRFGHWKRRLQKIPNDHADTHWLELPSVPASSSSGWDIELELGQGLRLRLRQH
jgi:hypothetical protein